MISIPSFLDTARPPLPNIVIPRGVLPFHLPDQPVRGRLVRLGPLADALLSRHSNPSAISKLAGEALALTAGVAAGLKFQGSFSLHAKGNGPLAVLFADCTNHGALRFYARLAGAKDTISAQASAHMLLGDGVLAFTVDQGPATAPYQGIVAIEGTSLADIATHYFAVSEQLPAFVRLAAGETPSGWRAGGLMLERIATTGNACEEDAWEEVTALAGTVTNEELLDDLITSEGLLHRLFHGTNMRVESPRPLSFGCRCSRARLSSVLERFPPNELDEMAINGEIVMTCEFCNCDFRFSRDELQGRTRTGGIK